MTEGLLHSTPSEKDSLGTSTSYRSSVTGKLVGGIKKGANRPRRIAFLILAAALTLFFTLVWPDFPHETVLEYSLGSSHGDITELSIAYTHQGEEIHGVKFHYPSGAPATVTHSVDLPHGRYEIHIELLRHNQETQNLVKVLRTPVDGVVRFNVVQQSAPRYTPAGPRESI